MGFYSSEIGYRELDNPALKYYGALSRVPARRRSRARAPAFRRSGDKP